MNRTALSGTFALVVLALGVLVWGAVDEAAPAAQNPNSVGNFAAASGAGEPVAVVLEYADGSARRYALADATAPPTASPTLTAIPPSATPLPTNTPRPSATSTATATTTPAPTETDEPTVTPEPPIPTVTATAVPNKVCQVRARTALNVRSGPGLSASVVSLYLPTVDITFTRFADADGYLWGQAAAGWSALYNYDTRAWLVYGLTGVSEICADVPGWPGTLDTPAPIVYERAGHLTVLYHFVPGGNIDELIAAGHVLAARGYPWGALVIDDAPACAKIILTGGRCIARHAWANGQSEDCPDVTINPVLAAKTYLPATRDYLNRIAALTGRMPYRVAIANECNFDQGRAAWWGAFVAEAVRLADDWGWPPLIAPQFYAHQPLDDQWVKDSAAGWLALQASGGGVGLHAYSIVDGDGLCALDRTLIQWGARYVTQHDQVSRWMVAAGAGGVELWYTEAARGFGNSPVLESDFVCYGNYLEKQREVAGVAFWTVGLVGSMPNGSSLDGHMVAIARGIVG